MSATQPRTRWVLVGILLAALVLAGLVSLVASTDPDGLTRVAADLGLIEDDPGHHRAHDDVALLGYQPDFIAPASLGRAVAGITGVLVVLVLAGGLTMALRRRER